MIGLYFESRKLIYRSRKLVFVAEKQNELKDWQI